MKMNVRNILVPVDFSETSRKALAHASFLARLTKSHMDIIHVLPVSPYYLEIPEPMLYVNNHSEVNQLVGGKLEEFSDEIHGIYGIRPRHILAHGQVAYEIVKAAREGKADLVIMGTHGAKGFEELFIGSNAHKVVTLAPCPVITIQEHAGNPGFRNIVLPIDRSRHSREKVETALSFALLYQSVIHILGLLDGDDENEYGKLQIVLDQVQHAVEHAGLAFSRHTIRGGNLASEALKYGISVNADLIIILTDHESALTGIFPGPLARQIVNHSRIPVMSLKPHYGSFETLDLSGAYSAY
ncbi:MAG TPA: universal stress protein [Bacteroidia bacterium]|nr:universal stress protein [Bacteroidia bacterium]